MRKLTVKARTDVGLRRDHNEDYYGFVEELGLFVVCDGMGGHASGEVASRMTVEHVVEFVNDYYEELPADMPYGAPEGASPAEALLSNAIQYANDRVYVEGMKDSNLEGMGTTVVAMLAESDRLVVAHVGDSRVYCFNQSNRLLQVTRDHSLLNHKIDRGELKSAEDIANFKQGNIIVRAVGLKDYVSPEVQTVVRRPDDIFLLCSDGLTDLVDDWLIESVMEANSDTLDEGNQALIRMANDRGGKDNITVMLVRIDDEPEDEAHVADAQEEEEEEVTDPGGIAAVEEVTDPGYIDEGDAATEEDYAVDGAHSEVDPFEATDVQGIAFDETQPELPMAPSPAQSAGPSVDVQSGATTAGKKAESKGGRKAGKKAESDASLAATEPELTPPPSVIIEFDDTSEELPSFIIDLD
ncbi:MAG: Stp1/IreP family PP2C-type Ser/Thr phosphatase [Myxococcota bacterium]|nr:Stp1/IreP family PP2C-type Ser/Thr phosphatase [Myxococcota bacterium]